MIIDSLINKPLNAVVARSPGLSKAISWLNDNIIVSDLGRHEIDGDRIFAIIEEYETLEDVGARTVETHRRFVDVQLVVEGAELIDWWEMQRLRPSQDYDAQRDLLLHDHQNIAPLPIVLQSAMYAVFFPYDAHRPKGAVAGAPRKVRKAVVKVDIDLI